MSSLDLDFVDRTVHELGGNPEMVIPILQRLQGHYRYLPEEALKRVCQLTQITPAAVTGVSTFYSQFRHKPVGKHIISVCHGTACHVKGAGLVQDAFENELQLSADEDTSDDGLFTIEKVACLGCCTLAPVVQIDELTYGRLTPSMVSGTVEDFLRNQNGVAKGKVKRSTPVEAPVGEIRVGLGSCCVAQGSGQVRDAIDRVLMESGASAAVKRVGCVGMCHQTPLVEIVTPDTPSKLYARVQSEDAPGIVLNHFRSPSLFKRIGYSVNRLIDRFYSDEPGDPVQKHAISPRDGPVCAFLGRQRHLATEFCGQIDPIDLDEYLRHDGFKGLKKAIEDHSPKSIIDEVKSAGLRGRGGAGFPTGRKWEVTRNAEGEKKFVVCNGDEGDPGAFMDRMILESFPYRVIEGIAIAARAVGASEGLFYIRAEYPLAVQRVREALVRCEERGILGNSVMGSDFSLKLSIKEGAGAFVCGEETALISSIEGKRGMPRLRPPYPAESGLWGRPTSVNNVETYALVPWILRSGADKFRELGTPQSTGTKVFALAGKVARGGLIEVPMGITLREVVDEVGGGVAGGKRLKAVQVGGPSGGCVPAELCDTPVDFEELSKVGAIMGSGGLVVLDEDDCMVDIARYFLEFTQDQSCGKCTFCRVGTRRMLDILERICTGKGERRDLATLEQLSGMVKQGSICGLGKTAPNPVLSTLKYFRHEYEAHIAGHCPGGKCKDLIAYKVNDQCIGCTKCSQVCPADAIPMTPYVRHTIDVDKCTRCNACREVCPEGAVFVE